MIPPRSGRRRALILGSLPPTQLPSAEQIAPYSIEQAQELLSVIREAWQSRTLARLVLAARAYQRGRDVADAQEELRELFYTAHELATRLHNMSPAARRELGWAKPGQPARVWGSITSHVVTLMDLAQDKAAPAPGRGRSRLPAREAMLTFIREIARTYWIAIGRRPGISKPPNSQGAPAGGVRSGRFLRFLRAAIAPFPDLAEKKDGNIEKLFREAMEGVDPNTAFGQALARGRKRKSVTK